MESADGKDRWKRQTGESKTSRRPNASTLDDHHPERVQSGVIGSAIIRSVSVRSREFPWFRLILTLPFAEQAPCTPHRHRREDRPRSPIASRLTVSPCPSVVPAPFIAHATVVQSATTGISESAHQLLAASAPANSPELIPALSCSECEPHRYHTVVSEIRGALPNATGKIHRPELHAGTGSKLVAAGDHREAGA